MAKESRVKKHLAATRPKVSSHVLVASANIPDPITQNDLTEMRMQKIELQSQLTRLKGPKVDQPKHVQVIW